MSGERFGVLDRMLFFFFFLFQNIVLFMLITLFIADGLRRIFLFFYKSLEIRRQTELVGSIIGINKFSLLYKGIRTRTSTCTSTCTYGNLPTY